MSGNNLPRSLKDIKASLSEGKAVEFDTMEWGIQFQPTTEVNWTSAHPSAADIAEYHVQMIGEPPRSTETGAVKRVLLSSGAYRSCLNHALSTEKEEVMGLLVGWTVNNFVYVCDTIMLKRSDKRVDRVEISDIQLARASSLANELSLSRQREMAEGGCIDEMQLCEGQQDSPIVQAAAKAAQGEVQMVGWYHSHPHITPVPSAVDLRTQAQYQEYIERTFVGLIFSTFDTDKTNGLGALPYLAFQADHNQQQILIPVCVVPTSDLVHPSSLPDSTLRSITDLPQLMLEESEEAYQEEKAMATSLLHAHHDAALHSTFVLRILHHHLYPLQEHLKSRSRLLHSLQP